MARSRTKRRKPRSDGSTRSGDKAAAVVRAKKRRIIGAIVLVAVVLTGGYYYWLMSRAEGEFLALATEGRAALSRVEDVQTAGRGHLEPGRGLDYGERFPTSGIHAPSWVQAGVYDSPQRPTELVHALEHGNIVIYYDQPGDSVMETLRRWVGLYGGQWDGVVVTPMPGLGEKIVVTAWTKRLALDRFEAPVTAAMIDAYRGRGPEHPVR